MPKATRLIWRAEVPLVVAIAYFLLTIFAIESSNFLIRLPFVEIHPESIQSFKYCHSFPFKKGSERGILGTIGGFIVAIVFTFNHIRKHFLIKSSNQFLSAIRNCVLWLKTKLEMYFRKINFIISRIGTTINVSY